MTHHDDLVRWLYENGFCISRQEAVFDDGKYYTVICAVFDGAVRSCDLYASIIGALDTDDELSRGFLRRSLNNLRNRSRGDESLLPVIKRLEESIHEDK